MSATLHKEDKMTKEETRIIVDVLLSAKRLQEDVCASNGCMCDLYGVECAEKYAEALKIIAVAQPRQGGQDGIFSE